MPGLGESVPGGAWSGGRPGPGGSAPGGVPGGDHPPPMATAAGGTHPTGMHSCFIYFINYFIINYSDLKLRIKFLPKL